MRDPLRRRPGRPLRGLPLWLRRVLLANPWLLELLLWLLARWIP